MMTRPETTEFLGSAEWVQWVDTAGDGNWQDIVDARKMEPEVIHSLGFVIREDEKCIVLAQSLTVNRHNNVDSVLAIPKVAIQKRWTVR